MSKVLTIASSVVRVSVTVIECVRGRLMGNCLGHGLRCRVLKRRMNFRNKRYECDLRINVGFVGIPAKNKGLRPYLRHSYLLFAIHEP